MSDTARLILSWPKQVWMYKYSVLDKNMFGTKRVTESGQLGGQNLRSFQLSFDPW